MAILHWGKMMHFSLFRTKLIMYGAADKVLNVLENFLMESLAVTLFLLPGCCRFFPQCRTTRRMRHLNCVYALAARLAPQCGLHMHKLLPHEYNKQRSPLR